MKQRKLRIYFNSNAMWATSGYSTQMYHLLPALAKEGFSVALGSFFGLEGGIIDINGVRCYPKIGDIWGADGMTEHARDFNADIVISFQDIWVLHPQVLQQIKRWIPYVPIDHDPAPQSIIDRLKLAYRVLSYSKFGKEELSKNGIYSNYIPHMVDLSIFKPMDKRAIRKTMNIPEDVFLFGMVAANKDNPPRKSFQEALDAFKLFHDKNPKSAMYIHTLPDQNGGFPIKEYAKFLGIGNAIHFLNPYDLLYKVDRDGMARIYAMLDCLLMPSTNEGFGVPAIEAQACDVPVIVNNFTSMPELVKPGETGEITDVAYKRFSPLLSYVGIPSTQSIYEKMEKIYQNQADYKGKPRKFMVEEYAQDIVLPQWIKFLEKIEREVYPEEVVDKKIKDK